MASNHQAPIHARPAAAQNRVYAAIDLKSFYASAECRERGLDPLSTNLVVADLSRTEKTICLAVSPSLRSLGIPGRARLFEVIQKISQINARRLLGAPGHAFAGSSWNYAELLSSPHLSLDYITAPPRMALYMDYSTKIYHIYLNYVAPEDIHAYSIDEVFIDLTGYLSIYRMSPRELAMRMMLDVLGQTGITATAGIGANLYLAKAAMDIVAKRVPQDKHGVRIATLDEMSYRRLLWSHRPLTDFWRIGRGYARKLEEHGLYTMGDVARCSLGKPGDFHNEELLYRLFGVNAELLIDHAWGWEPCTLQEIKAYQPETNSLSSGQVLRRPYPFDKARLVIREMADQLALSLVDKGLVTDQLVLEIGYDRENLSDPRICAEYRGPVATDRYGRQVPGHAHGTKNLPRKCSSARWLTDAATELFERIADPNLSIRRLNLSATHVVSETNAEPESYQQLNLFTDYGLLAQKHEEEDAFLQKEKQLQKALLSVKKKYGKNAILKGMNFEEGATARERNQQIGGHKA